jgi:hypothetical protein
VTILRLSLKQKPHFSNPTFACSPKLYNLQNSATVQLAVGGKEGNEHGAFVGMEIMPRRAGTKGLPEYGILGI